MAVGARHDDGGARGWAAPMEGGCGFGLPSGQEWMRSSARSGMGWSSRLTRFWRHTGGEEDNHYVSDSEHPSTSVVLEDGRLLGKEVAASGYHPARSG